MRAPLGDAGAEATFDLGEHFGAIDRVETEIDLEIRVRPHRNVSRARPHDVDDQCLGLTRWRVRRRFEPSATAAATCLHAAPHRLTIDLARGVAWQRLEPHFVSAHAVPGMKMNRLSL